MCFIYPSLLWEYEEYDLMPRRCIINIVDLMSFNFNREREENIQMMSGFLN